VPFDLAENPQRLFATPGVVLGPQKPQTTCPVLIDQSAELVFERRIERSGNGH